MKKRSGFQVMLGLIGLIKPMLGFLALAIMLGCLGNLAATFLTILGGYGLLNVVGIQTALSLKFVIVALLVLAVCRGILRYTEQACNHYIAFKLLAQIRHHVFQALRRLAPAKLDGVGKGNLISILTSDIELLEVFYAHTISPIAIAVITSVVMIVFIGTKAPLLAVVAAAAYLLVGAFIPYWNGRRGRAVGQAYRKEFGALNTTVLDNLYGLEEIIQYGQQEKRLEKMADDTKHLQEKAKELRDKENKQSVLTNSVILLAGFVAVCISVWQVQQGTLAFSDAIISVIAIMSSFGPTAALSALSNNLNQTLASGDRVLNLLEEEPVVEPVINGKEAQTDVLRCEDVTFSYDEEMADGRKVDAGTRTKRILNHFNAEFLPDHIYGILGKSGCGKSTLLKLLLRFYETESGAVFYGTNNVNEVTTDELHKKVSYVTQETFLFSDTIENNIKIAKGDATHEEVVTAAKKASIHDFIMSLPNGYDTKLAELGDSVSGGEKQRIGIARAFLQGSDIILLDEPTSNIDSLNEAIILKSLYEEKKGKTILLVSHRKSTMGIADHVIEMQA